MDSWPEALEWSLCYVYLPGWMNYSRALRESLARPRVPLLGVRGGLVPFGSKGATSEPRVTLRIVAFSQGNAPGSSAKEAIMEPEFERWLQPQRHLHHPPASQFFSPFFFTAVDDPYTKCFQVSRSPSFSYPSRPSLPLRPNPVPRSARSKSASKVSSMYRLRLHPPQLISRLCRALP